MRSSLRQSSEYPRRELAIRRHQEGEVPVEQAHAQTRRALDQRLEQRAELDACAVRAIRLQLQTAVEVPSEKEDRAPRARRATRPARRSSSSRRPGRRRAARGRRASSCGPAARAAPGCALASSIAPPDGGPRGAAGRKERACGGGLRRRASRATQRAALYSMVSRLALARAAPIAVFTSFSSSGGGSTAGRPSASIHSSRDQPVV